MRYGRGDCLDAGKRTGDDLFLAGYVTDVCLELGDEVQMVELPWRTPFPLVVRRSLMACDPSGW
jgi:hypothetical protein